MQDYGTNNYGYNDDPLDRRRILSSQMARVFGWMFIGLIITGITSFFVVSSETMLVALLSNRLTLLAFAVIELVLVMFISSRAMHMQYATAAMSFVLYSIVNGVTLSVIFLVYTASSIWLAFFMVAGFFGFMSLYGLLTKADLTSLGSMLTMGLIGLIIVSVVNIFLKSSGLYWIISIAGVAIFLGLTAYDTQKINQISVQYTGTEVEKNVAIVGALVLYLDFVNLFLYVLRLLGKRK